MDYRAALVAVENCGRAYVSHLLNNGGEQNELYTSGIVSRGYGGCDIHCTHVVSVDFFPE
jgi:hypothetical protein